MRNFFQLKQMAKMFRSGSSRLKNLRRAMRPNLEGLEVKQVPAIVNPLAVNLPIAIGLTPHAWTPDSAGLYHTSTNLATEWQGNYQTMLNGQGASLSPVQRLEGNAEAVFENTGLNNLTTAQQAIDREDLQREFDAIAAAQSLAQQQLGIDPTKPFTQSTYLAVEQILQNNPVLLELAVQGHGLNTPPSARYNGYTNDLQNNVDTTTLFIGGGLNNNKSAVASLLDDNILSHMPFNVVWKNGVQTQLNQNGTAESSLDTAVLAFDDSAYGRVYKSANFSTTSSTINNSYKSPFTTLINASKINVNQAPSNGTLVTLFGAAPVNITSTPHTWTADPATGLYHTTTNLAAEWQTNYQIMLSGSFGSLSPLQRLEGNAEAVFETTGLSSLTTAQQAVDREDAQREFDAIATAMTQNKITGPMSQQQYLIVAQTIQTNPTLEELALQGHGLNSPPAARYFGYTNDFQNTVDNTTQFAGGGLNNGRRAITDFFDDNVISHLCYAVVWQNGRATQLNQNAAAENSLSDAVTAYNNTLFYRVYSPSDFNVQAGTGSAPLAGVVNPNSANVPIAAGLTPHAWTPDANGLYHTATDLNAEWQAYYNVMLSGQGATLTAVQRLEGNAQALFLNTGLNSLSTAQQTIDREDVQREYDALAAAQTLAQQQQGIDPAQAFNQTTYLAVEKTLQNNSVLLELAVQGHGLNTPPSARYNGYTNDFQHNVDTTTLFIGGGLNNNKQAIADFFDDNLLSHVLYKVIWRNGCPTQLNQNGAAENNLDTAVIALDDSAYGRVYQAADFSATASTLNNSYKSTFTTLVNASKINVNQAPTNGTIITLFGAAPVSITSTAHTWTADPATGLYHTNTDLAAEWQTNYQIMLSGNFGSLSPLQRLEGNAEAVFENTGLSKLSTAQIKVDREDAQREFDAIAAAMTQNNITGPMSQQQYLLVAQTIQTNPALEELALQGHGLNSPPAPRYFGYTNDFQHVVDTTSLFTGGGLNNYRQAIADFFDDNILSHLCFPVVWQNGKLTQLNQNGTAENSLSDAVKATNNTLFFRVYTATDFKTDSNATASSAVVGNLSPTTLVNPNSVNIPIAAGLTPHAWTPDANGLYHTATDLNAEWQAYYNVMLSGQGATLTAVQRLEGNAQALFLNTGLNSLSTAQQTIDREDVQREYDALAAAQTLAQQQQGIDPAQPFTEVTYLTVENLLQSNATLLELAVQGHGLNSPPSARYNGYTNDFQHNVDTTTLFIGGGLNNNNQAIADFLDDNLLSHVLYKVVWRNGNPTQLNQNGAAENNLDAGVIALDDSAYGRVYQAADFSATASTLNNGYKSTFTTLVNASKINVNQAPTNGTIITLFGAAPVSITSTAHTWTADPATGLYHTNTDLAAEWQTNYQIMLSGNFESLSTLQRLEGNAEAVFENTGLSKLSAAQLKVDREDAQREFDAIAAAMAQNNITGPFSQQQYLLVAQTIQANPALEELALQGHGLNSPPAPRYFGYTNDFQHNVDTSSLYTGGGLNNNRQAIADFFDDNVLSHLCFPVVWQNGKLTQLNQNANPETTLADAVTATNNTLFFRVYTSTDFNRVLPPLGTGTLAGVVNPGSVNLPISAGLTPHTWTPDSNGLYHTSTNLAAEWQSYYQIMLNGQGSTLTAVQRLEGNAEAVFENTGLKNLSVAQLTIDREDVQREFDALAAAQTLAQQQQGIDSSKPFTQTTYLAVEKILQNNSALLELAVQGHGLNTPPSARYNGYTNDFQHNVDTTTLFIGGGLNNNKQAIADFFDDNLLSHVPFKVVWKNGVQTQLNQNGAAETTLDTAVLALDDSAYGRVYKDTNFSTTASTLNNGYKSTFTTLVNASKINVNQAPANGTLVTLFGAAPVTITATPHTWTADAATGLYHTNTDLAAEWQRNYQIMLSGNFGSLSPLQRLEGNAEAVFENTGLSKLSTAQIKVDREDAQREFDAIAAAMTQNNITGPITQQQYLLIAQTIQTSPALEELALQGHGLNTPPAPRYFGYTNDFQHNVDTTTLFIGGGLNNNQQAIADLFDDSILTHLCFPVVWQNGKLIQLNQNAAAENLLSESVTAFNNTYFFRVYTSTDFKP